MALSLKIRTSKGETYDEALGAASLSDAQNRCASIALSGLFVEKDSQVVENGAYLYWPPHKIDYIYVIDTP
jgi:hypothetical protein